MRTSTRSLFITPKRKLFPITSHIRFASTVREFEEIPGPKGIEEFFALGGFSQLNKVHSTLKEKYGDIVSHEFFGRKLVYLFHPDYIQTAFQNEGKYPRGILETIWPLFEFNKKYFGEKRTFHIQSGEDWRSWRSKVQKDIFSPKDAATYLPLMEKCVDEATDAYPEWVNGPNHRLFYSVTSLNLLQNIFYNQGLDIWKGDFDKNPIKPVVNAALDAFQDLIVLAAHQKETAPKELLEKFDSNMKITYDSLTEIVEKVISSKDFSPENTAFSSFFAKLIERDEFEKWYYVQLGAGLLFAAVDTTATALHWFTYNLARSPRAQQKLYEEVKSVMGDGPMKIEHLTKIPYMKECLKENFRVSTTTARVDRITPEEIVIGGYKIPANTILSLAPFYTYCLDSKIFHDPLEFIPERWNREKKGTRSDTLHDHPYMVIPFSSGPRMCLGARVAELETMAFIAKLVQKYKISLHPDSPKIVLNTNSAPFPVEMPKFILEKRV